MNTNDLRNMLIAEKAKGIQYIKLGDGSESKKVNLKSFSAAFSKLTWSTQDFRNYFVPYFFINFGHAPTYEAQESNPDEHKRVRLSKITYENYYKGLETYTTCFEDVVQKLCESDDYINKNGRFMIRLSKAWYKKYNSKLPEAFMAKMGSELNNHVIKPKELYFDFVDVFDWQDGDFGHSGSCWFLGGAYEESLPTFQNNGGWAIRFYELRDLCSGHARHCCESMHIHNVELCRYGSGRTWLFPMENCLIGFNTYGNERADVIAVLRRVMKQYTNDELFVESSVSIYNSYDCNIPYINDNRGFCFSTCVEYPTKFDLDMHVEGIECYSCGGRVNENDAFFYDDERYCNGCFYDTFTCCNCCYEYIPNDDAIFVSDANSYYCEDCVNRGKITVAQCEDCGEHNLDDYAVTEEGTVYCLHCADMNCETCEECKSLTDDYKEIEGEYYCYTCAKEIEEQHTGEETITNES